MAVPFLLTATICFILLAQTIARDSYRTQKKNFLSVLVRGFTGAPPEIIIEFIRHYIEEGVDHFYIYDESSKGSQVADALFCIDRKYYTVYRPKQIGLRPSNKAFPDLINSKMYDTAQLHQTTAWLMVLEVHDFIMSRAAPHLTIRQILVNNFKECAIVSIPGLVFSWASHSSDTISGTGGRYLSPENDMLQTRRQLSGEAELVHSSWKGKLRSSLEYRWMSANDGLRSSYENLQSTIENVFIVRTSKMEELHVAQYAAFDDKSITGGMVCMSRSIDMPLSCAGNSTSLHANYIASTVLQAPNKRGGYYLGLDNKNFDRLERWCAFRNAFRSLESPAKTLIKEGDINGFLLANFQFRLRPQIPTSTGNSPPTESGDKFEIHDTFFNSIREPARRASSDYMNALAAVRKCSAVKHHLTAHEQAVAQAIGSKGAAVENHSCDLLKSPVSWMPPINYAQLQEDLKEQLAVENGSADHPYFFSLMVLELNEVDIILEFVKHYIEEGASHFFIFDDGSTDGSVEALSCVDSRYLTVFTRRDFGIDPSDTRKLQQREVYNRMYLDLDVRHKTVWLGVVDVDELVTSRAYPQVSIREILKHNFADCGVIAVPWLVYSWGNQAHDPKNSVREKLFYRWGFDDSYNVKYREEKFHNPTEGEWVKVIFKTAQIPSFFTVHNATFENPAVGGTVCVPHTDAMLHCAAQRCEYINKDYFGAVIQDPYRSLGYFLDSSRRNQGLHQWCPYNNRYRAIGSYNQLNILEPDIDKLELAMFHYRVKSWEDWHRKAESKGRRGTGRYEGHEKEANRLDIFDDFMVSVRSKAREEHPYYLNAIAIFEMCPAKYFVNVDDLR